MAELTITYTIQLPDNDEDVQKLLNLLYEADSYISNNAQERIARMDGVAELLEEALGHPRPADYQRRIIEAHQATQSWIRARDLARTIVFGQFHTVQKILIERKGTP